MSVDASDGRGGHLSRVPMGVGVAVRVGTIAAAISDFDGHRPPVKRQKTVSGQIVLIGKCPHPERFKTIPKRSPVRMLGKMNLTGLHTANTLRRSATPCDVIPHYGIDRNRVRPGSWIWVTAFQRPVQGLQSLYSAAASGEAQQVVWDPQCESCPDP